MSEITLYTEPRLSGIIRETSFYRLLTLGETRPILLIGHADAVEMYAPYRVVSLKNAVNFLNADSSSPLLRSMLEVYNAGARDIWLYPVAPMSEYRQEVADRNTTLAELGDKTFYELYAERLADAYSILSNYDTFQIVVPLEASCAETGGVDFIEPLAQFCEDTHTKTSQPVISVIGTRSSGYSQALFDEMTSNPVLDTLGDKGRYVLAVVGEAVMANTQMTRTYSTGFAAAIAALLGITPLSRSVFGMKLTGALQLNGFDLSDAQINQLSEAKYNPVVRTKRGKRNELFESWLLTDNSLAPTGSDYWSINQTRVVSDVISNVTRISDAYIGTLATENFKQVVYDYMRELVRFGEINNFALDVEFIPRTGRANLTFAITPIFGVRNIYFTVETGPGS